MPDESLLTTIRASLEEERAQLRQQLDELEAGNEASLTFDENFADSGQVAAEQGEAKALAGTLKEQLDDVERALKKMDEGKYGLCEVDNQPINDARLEAMPATRFCIEHA